MIGIIKSNFNKIFVNEHALDSLIAADKIIACNRSNEWAVVGRDSVRKQINNEKAARDGGLFL